MDVSLVHAKGPNGILRTQVTIRLVVGPLAMLSPTVWGQFCDHKKKWLNMDKKGLPVIARTCRYRIQPVISEIAKHVFTFLGRSRTNQRGMFTRVYT